jgi:beta-glucanase (GH16 family)
MLVLLVAVAGMVEFTGKALGAHTAQAGWTLVWSDEFNGPNIDPNNWGYEIGYIRNNELQYYTNRPENARIENGNLLIEGRKESYNGYNYTSASLITKGKREFQYGRIEMRAKLPYSQGAWPAFWTMGAKGSPVDTACWPATGEIDIMELVGGGIRDSQIHGTAHWNSGDQTWCGADHDGEGVMYQLPSGKFADAYHIFAIEWSATQIKWFMDDINYHTLDITAANLSELRQAHYILLNLAIGGGWPGSPDATSVFPMKFYVDYVRVYTNCASCPTPTPTNTPTPVKAPLRIEAGGSANFTDTSGNVWSASADTSYALGGGTVDRGAVAIANTDNDKIYQTERWGVARYDIPVSSGSYTVKLHFAETWLSGAGQRVFDVNVEGQALNGLDVFAQAGGKNIALVKTFNNVAVSDGVLTITFTKGTEATIINGVEVLAGATTNPTPTPTTPTAVPTRSPNPTPTPTTAPPTGTNKLTNPGLESGNTGWNGVAGSWSILQPGSSNTNTGAWAFKATTTQQYGSGTGPSQTITNVPTNTSYVARFWVKGTGRVKMVVNNSSWGYITGAQCTPTTTWTQCSVSFNTGSNTSLIIQMQDHAAGTAYVDDLYVGAP